MRDFSAPWPGYREAPEHLNIAREVLDGPVAAGLGERVALLHEGGRLTYGELARRVAALAGAFGALGVDRGERVVVRMASSPEFAVAFLALLKSGAVPVLTNSLLTPAELAYVVGHAEPRLVITEAARAEEVRRLGAESRGFPRVVCARGASGDEIPFETLLEGAPRPEAADTRASEPAFVVYTSGTTGRPKGIVHAHRWIVALGDANRLRLPPLAGDVVMATGEWSFISALGHNLLFPLRNGVTGAILPGRATPETVLGAVARWRVTVLYSVATVYRRILATEGIERRFDVSSLRYANATGEPLGEATYREWTRRFGSELLEHYGVSELQLVVGQGPRQPVRPGSIGKPVPGVNVAVLDEDYAPVPVGQLGQFLIRADDPGMFLGYEKDPERTATVVHDGWYHTGDLAYVDADGYIFIAGRRDECFKSRGIFISPGEIENALRQHPALVEAAVVPEPDREIGNRVRAVVVTAAGETPSRALADAIRADLLTRLAPFKVPHTIEFAEALPKSPIGKILRREVARRRFRAGLP